MADPPAIIGPDGRPLRERAYKAPSGGGYGGRGGLLNPQSGLGGSSDKGANTFFRPTRYYWRSPLEILRVESWAAGKAIAIPVDDMFLRWREHSDGDV